MNTEDDNGDNWALLANAVHSSEVHAGAVMVAGTFRFWSVVLIKAVDADGHVNFVQLDDSDHPK